MARPAAAGRMLADQQHVAIELEIAGFHQHLDGYVSSVP
jgi:hypothetical protein